METIENGRFVEPIESMRTFETAIDHLVEGIERSGLTRGARLPTERDLSAELQISIPTLRQALTVLSRSGMVESRQGKGGGWFVRSELVPMDALSAAVAGEKELALETLSARRLVETPIVHYVALTCGPEDVARLDRVNELMAEHVRDSLAVAQADAAFHRALVLGANNLLLQEAMRRINRQLLPLQHAFIGSYKDNLKILRIHRQQTEAIRERDLNALDPLLDVHFGILEDAYAAAAGRRASKLFRDVRSVSV